MNKIVEQILSIIKSNMDEYLPDVPSDQYEESGKVYYMNGRNGTEFEWHVNNCLPSFMVFYDDEDNLGAAKLVVNTDGEASLFLYGDHGKTAVKEIKTSLDVEKTELLKLAVCLSRNADDEEIWDAAIDRIDSDYEPDDEEIAEFNNGDEDFEDLCDVKSILEKAALVSKKITEGGWKVGYLIREDPEDEIDSGWQFFAGDEDDDYVEQESNVTVCSVGDIVKLDPALMSVIGSEPGVEFVRVSSDEFEEDDEQDPYMEKWKE